MSPLDLAAQSNGARLVEFVVSIVILGLVFVYLGVLARRDASRLAREEQERDERLARLHRIAKHQTDGRTNGRVLQMRPPTPPPPHHPAGRRR